MVPLSRFPQPCVNSQPISPHAHMGGNKKREELDACMPKWAYLQTTHMLEILQPPGPEAIPQPRQCGQPLPKIEPC